MHSVSRFQYNTKFKNVGISEFMNKLCLKLQKRYTMLL